MPTLPKKPLSVATTVIGVAWLIGLFDWMWVEKLNGILPYFIEATATGAAALALVWSVKGYQDRQAHGLRLCLILTAAFVPVWHASVLLSDAVGLPKLRVELAWWGTMLFYLMGLAWTIWSIDRAGREYERRRRELETARATERMLALSSAAALVSFDELPRSSHPLDPNAWFYGRRANKLNQSLTAFSAYSLLFLIFFLLATQLGGCEEIYEMPAGGGQPQMAVTQTVRVEKVIKKKFVVNPFAAISFKVPPIDEVKLQLQEATAHQYAVGYGSGAGAGFAGGTKAGKVRFIRLEYQGGDWDQEFSTNSGCDYLMLLEYGLRTKQKVGETVESKPVAQLRNFPAEKAPPFVYMTGQRNIQLSASEIKILREYLLDKHGMLFADNGGSAHWHNQFFAMMKQVLPNVQATPIPLDDVIHRTPYQIPFLPLVAPHGGKESYGWRVDGRLVCYYHPGDIGDAWSDDHSGVSREVWEACYQLGTNVIFYAHAEYAKWLESRQKK